MAHVVEHEGNPTGVGQLIVEEEDQTIGRRVRTRTVPRLGVENVKTAVSESLELLGLANLGSRAASTPQDAVGVAVVSTPGRGARQSMRAGQTPDGGTRRTPTQADSDGDRRPVLAFQIDM